FAAGRSNPDLTEEIAKELGTTLVDQQLEDFANGEIRFRFRENIRGADVFIFQTHADPVNKSIMEQLIMIDAAKRASAKRISAVIPFYGYSRQDRKSRGREPISGRLVADLLTIAGADRVLSVDLHADQIQGFFDKPVDHLTALPLLEQHFLERFDGDVVVVSPDAGPIKVLVITNTLPIPPEKQLDKITVLSIAPIVASTIRAVFEDKSVSEIFQGQN